MLPLKGLAPRPISAAVFSGIPRPVTLNSRLLAVFGICGAACLLLCGTAVFHLARVERKVKGVANRIDAEAVPATQLAHQVDRVRDRITRFSRMRGEAERQAVVEAFRSAVQGFGRARISAIGENQGAEIAALSEAALPLLQAWQIKFQDAADQFLRAERSTRALAAQCSLLTTLCAQLFADDGTDIPGARAAEHRPVMLGSLARLSEIQNNVLLASSLLDPSFVGRARQSLERAQRDFRSLIDATAPSDLWDFLTEVNSQFKDVGDELRNLELCLQDQNRTEDELMRAAESVAKLIDPVVPQLVNDTAEVSAETAQDLRSTVIVLAIGAVMFPLAGIGIARLLAGRITRFLAPLAYRLRETSSGIAVQTSQSESTSAGLAALTEEQAGAVEQSNATVDELTRSAEQSLRDLRAITQHLEHTSERVANGDRSVAVMSDAMNDITSASTRIHQVVATIDEIAFQTNILALNAAIEAARAGDAGRGFAVVAEEVRRLAHRSADAAKETSELIVAAQSTTTRGVEAARNVAQDFQAIVGDLVKMRPLLQQTTCASQLQTSEVRSLSTMLHQLQKGTVTSATTAKDFAEFAYSLNQHAGQLDEDAARLSLFLAAEPTKEASPAASTIPPAALLGAAGPVARDVTREPAGSPHRASRSAISRSKSSLVKVTGT